MQNTTYNLIFSYMRNLTLLAGLLIASVALLAQKNQLQNTSNALKFNELDKAKIAIDLATEHEDTKSLPKMWYLRGKTYFLISQSIKFKSLDVDAAEKGTLGFINCLKSDKDKIFTDSISQYAVSASVNLYNNVWNVKYKANDYDGAVRCLTMIFDVMPYDKHESLKRSNLTPTSLNYDIYTLYKAKKDNDKAKEYLQKLMDVNYKDPTIYVAMAIINIEEKDTAKALSFIEKGLDRREFEDNAKLIDWQMKIYFMQKNEDKLLEKASKAIEVAPENPVLYYIRGLVYQNKKQNDKAEQDLKKSLELNDASVDANYQLGKLYYDRGGEWLKKSDALNPNELNTKGKEYDTKSQEDFKRAVANFEKAHDVNPKDDDVNKALLSAYRLVGDMDKYNKLKESIIAKPK